VPKRDDFSTGVKRVLAHRAGFQCSKPSCRALTAGPAEDGTIRNVGVAAHITAASPKGPRYDDSLSPEERASALNGIWLCQTHAKEVDDDAAEFTVEVLRGWKEHAEEAARAMLGRPVTGHEFDVAMEVSLQRASDGGVVVVGKTNLPTGTKLMLDLRGSGSNSYYGTSRSEVHGGFLVSQPFPDDGTPLRQDWYGVRVLAYINGPWKQPKQVEAILGKHGAHLVGEFAVPIDPDVEDSDVRFEAQFECLAPAPSSQGPMSDAELGEALDLLRRSRLEVRGHEKPLSHNPVGEVVGWFLGTSGLSIRDGWRATEHVPGVVEIGFSFWNGERPAEALWHVIPSSGSVRYRNRHAKYMSWSPDY